MVDMAVLGFSYLGIAGSLVGLKLQSNPDGIHELRVDRYTMCEFPVHLPMVLAPDIEWIGQGNFTEYHLKMGVDSFARECRPTRKKPFAYSCFNVASAYFTFKYFTPTKEYICQSTEPCEVSLKKSRFSGKRPHLKSSLGETDLKNLEEKAKFWYMGPAKARAWSKQILLKRTGVREFFKYNSFIPGAVEEDSIISEPSLSNELIDKIYGIDITSI